MYFKFSLFSNLKFFSCVVNLKLFILLLNLFNVTYSYIPNANLIISSEQIKYNMILNNFNLPCHIQSARVKNFESAIIKMNKLQLNDIYDIHDLIAFRYVFYEQSDLYKFYHTIRTQKNIMYVQNYINKPKENGYSAIHIRYRNEYNSCPISQMECQLYLINDYYEALYGKAKNYKNFSMINYD